MPSQTGKPGLLGASTLRTLVRDRGRRIRALEQTEAVVLRQHAGGRRLRGVPVDRPRRCACLRAYVALQALGRTTLTVIRSPRFTPARASSA